MNIDNIKFALSDLILPVVTLIGPPGGGKTEVGSLLAARLGWIFLDTDILIEQAAGLTIPEIFAQYGLKTFRLLEKTLIEKIAQLYSFPLESQGKTDYPIETETTAVSSFMLPQAQGTVISTGGGLPVPAENFAVLSRIGRLVHLYASIDVLAQRTARKRNRPLLNPLGLSDSEHDQQLRIKLLVEERQHIYAQADVSIDTSHLTVAAVVECIKKKLY